MTQLRSARLRSSDHGFRSMGSLVCTLAILALALLSGCGESGTKNRATELGERSVADVSGIDHPASELYQTQCAACHAADAGGNAEQKAPALTALAPWYIKRHLVYFRDGLRGTNDANDNSAAMAAASKSLSDTDIAGLADYIQQLPHTAPVATVIGDAKRGEDYHRNLCSACHGANGLGNEALGAPALVGLNDWYVVAQYQQFRAGDRGAHPDDRWGVQMVRLAPAVPEAEIVVDIAHYLNSLANAQ